jgi:hypothetical protein
MKKGTFIPSIIIFLTLLIITTGCATIYKSVDFESVREKHQTLAILPFDVTIEMKKLPEGMTPELLDKTEEEEATIIQSEIYAYFLKGKSKTNTQLIFRI